MSIAETFVEYFKPEIQKRGHEDYAKGLAFISNASDTQVQGYVKGMPPLKVAFRSDDISSPTFSASCTCSSAAKGLYCKHMWALLLAVEAKHPDFLESKTDIEKNDRLAKSERPTFMGQKTSPQAEAYKEKQAEFKKQQYEKQKAWAKERREEIKQNKKKKEKDVEAPTPRFPQDIEAALKFFTSNGFIMNNLPNEEELNKARKQLARVYHPDKGGSHDEAVSLNLHFEALSRFIEETNN